MFDNWKVVVVGAGTQGHSIAQVFAVNGFETTLVDQGPAQLEKARYLIANNVETLCSVGEMTEEVAREAQQRITFTDRLAPAASQANLVLEAIFEDASAKRALFTELDRLCPAETILVSNTSALNIFDIAEVSHPERLIIAHWCTPPHIMPLVEIVRGPQTAEDTVETMKALLIKLGKKPAMVNQYIPGFILNRIGQAIFREACYMVAQGWATPEDVDAALKATYGVRWPFEGPLELRDHIGWDVSLKVGSFVIPHLCNSTEPLGLAVELTSKGWLGVKTGRGLKDYSQVDVAQVQKERTLKILKMMKAIRELDHIG
ncbi:MAG: 3-hydroxyacyl-CoA dehydrogenase family protein [Firmicutes bacterium]|nr:3-hydroxyacyl-CoA dehydrogenase family protein [Bacillota bacterium]